jgi:hypothetical protein
MTTAWTTPTIITQYPKEGYESVDITWNDTEFQSLTVVGSGSVASNGTLIHIARAPKYDTMNNTYYLQATGFNFKNLPDQISGVTFRLTINRRGRVTDDTVQMVYQGEMIGKNQAYPAYLQTSSEDESLLSPISIYGGNSNTWKVENLTLAMVNDPTFGIVVRFKSHPQWPHNTPVYIQAMEIQIN